MATASFESLDEVRSAIDTLDARLSDLLVEREALVRRAGELKGSDAEVPAPARARAVVVRARERAADRGGDPDVAEAVWTAMVQAFIALELRHRAG